MARKTVKSKPAAISIECDDEQLCIELTNQGAVIGHIEDTLSVLHRMAVIAQGACYNENDNCDDYLSFYAKDLSKKYGVTVTESAAYKIANLVFGRFDVEKKS